MTDDKAIKKLQEDITCCKSLMQNSDCPYDYTDAIEAYSIAVEALKKNKDKSIMYSGAPYPEVENFKADLPDIIGDDARFWAYELCRMKIKKEELQKELEILEQEYEVLLNYGLPKFYEGYEENE